MSRSTRYTPKCGWTTARSEKQDKQLANRRLRQGTRQAIHHERDPPLMREVSNIWDFGKDGKQWFGLTPHKLGERSNYTDTDWWFRMMRK